MANREHPEVFTHYEPMSDKDIEETGVVPLAENRFNIAIQFRHRGKAKMLPPDIGEIKAF